MTMLMTTLMTFDNKIIQVIYTYIRIYIQIQIYRWRMLAYRGVYNDASSFDISRFFVRFFLHFWSFFKFMLQIGFLFNFTYFTYFVFYRLYILHIINIMIIATKFVIIIELSKYLHQNQILNILFNNITNHIQMRPCVLYIFYIAFFTYCILY